MAIFFGILGFVLALVIWGSIIGSVLIVVGAVALLEGGIANPLAWIVLIAGLAIAFSMD